MLALEPRLHPFKVRARSRNCVCAQAVFFGVLDTQDLQQTMLQRAQIGLQRSWQHVAPAAVPRPMDRRRLIRDQSGRTQLPGHSNALQSALPAPQPPHRSADSSDAALQDPPILSHEALNYDLVALARSAAVQQQIGANALFDAYQALQAAADGGRETRQGVRRAAEGVSAIFQDAFESVTNCTDSEGREVSEVQENAAAQCTYSPIMVYRGASLRSSTRASQPCFRELDWC